MRELTLLYYYRDSMIAYLLLEPVLSEGNGSATEAVISAVLERINRTDGSVCHEETIGDYATYLNQQDNITSTAPQYDYKMVDTDFFLPVVMKTYFVDNPTGKTRTASFFSTKATIDPKNADLTYADLALISVEKIMASTAPFAQPGGQIKSNLIHLKEGEIVGEWRDSTYGLGGGRIPYDVNAALVPAAPYRLASRRIVSYHPYPRVSSPSIERRPRRVQLPCPLPSTHAPPPPDILQYCAIVISSFDDPDRHRHRYRHTWRSSTIDDPETHFLSLFYFFFSSLFTTLRVHRSHLQRRGAVLASLLLASPFYRCLILCVARLGLGSLVRPGGFF